MKKLADFPKKLDYAEIEEKLVQAWGENGTYASTIGEANSNQNNPIGKFVVDTPPPTVSGSLHVGHVFSYTQTDIITRFQRMLGKDIFYPMGWDDNGLPTERRVQNYFGISCNPSLPYVENWKPEKAQKDAPIKEVSRQNFIEACAILTAEDEKAFERMWKRLGLSVDWNQTYATIDKHCIKISQLSFLDLVAKKYVYNANTPITWDVGFQSAIAQAEIEDRERPGAYHDLRFAVEGGGEFTISTTRPELLPACIAVVAHPDDERYQHLFGKKAITPLFHAEVPICAASHADPEKGTGILMVCTFGDANDVEWWKQSALPMKQVISRDGKLLDINFGTDPYNSQKPEIANKNYAELKGLFINQARKRIVELLQTGDSFVDQKSSALVGQPKPVNHPVKFYEKGDRPLEYVPTRQWYIKILEHKEPLLEQGKKIKWHPEYMYTRYEHWVLGLNQDWCISRQRFFGVPFPVWYPLNASAEPDYSKPIYAKPEELPVDPLQTAPAGFNESQRGQANGFIGDPDVMDTWATSSLTPQISSHWGVNQERHAKLFPCDIRPQAHEIIRTWAFYTIVKAWMHEGEIPWKHALISGWILDPDRKKMSKSVGNVVTPETILQQYSSDAVRYWTARARLGVDTAYDESLFKIGAKLANKLFNASRFVLMQLERVGIEPAKLDTSMITAELDRAWVLKLKQVVEQATKHFSNFEYAQALQVSEETFWDFCDFYLELVKVRSYSETKSPERDSACMSLLWSLKVFLRLFAPILPFVTEEIWSYSFAANDQDSVHKTRWIESTEVEQVNIPSQKGAYEHACNLISEIRAAKTNGQKSLKWRVESLTITTSAESIASIKTVLADVIQAGNIIDGGVNFETDATLENQLRAQVKLTENE